MKPIKPTISVYEYSLMLATGILGNVLFVWPMHVVAAAQEDAIWSVLLDILMLGIVMMVAQRGSLFGAAPWRRPMSWIILGPGLLLMAAVDAGLLALFIYMLQILFYADTPGFALLAPIIGVVIIMATTRLDGLGRLTQIWLPLVLLGILGVGLLGLIHAQSWRPLFPQTIHVLPILDGTEDMSYIAAPIIPMTILLLPHVSQRTTSSRLGAFYAIAVVSGILLVTYTLIIAMLGPDAIPKLYWPWVYALETISLDSTFFISRIGLAVIFLWTAIVSLALILHIQLFRLAIPPGVRWPSSMTSIVLGAGLGVGSLLFRTPIAANHWITQWMDPAIFTYLILASGLILGLGWWEKRRKPEESRSQTGSTNASQ